MAKYKVVTREVHVFAQEVEAESKEAALEKAVACNDWGYLVEIESPEPTLADVEEVPEPFVFGDGGASKRPFSVEVRQKREFTLMVFASDEEGAQDLAYEIEWPKSPASIMFQDVQVIEIEQVLTDA
jgi:hypothetical protein